MKSTTAASCCRSTFRHISPSLLALSCMAFLNVILSRAQTVTVEKNHSTAISKQAQNLALIPVKHHEADQTEVLTRRRASLSVRRSKERLAQLRL